MPQAHHPLHTCHRTHGECLCIHDGELSRDLRTWTDSDSDKPRAIPGDSRVEQRGKRISDGSGVRHAFLELFGEDRPAILSVDASPCNGGGGAEIGVGKVKHRSAKQLWTQGATQSYSVDAHKVLGAENASGVLTSPVADSEPKQSLQWME